MSKKQLSLVVLFLLLFTLPSHARNHNNENIAPSSSYVLGIDFPNFGWVQKNPSGEIIGYKGINLALGYSQKSYFKSYEYRKLNPYWGFGTVGLLFPYGVIGGDYALPIDNNGSSLNIGLGIMVAVFVPAPYLAISYVF